MKKLHCDLCSESFDRKFSLNRHRQHIHRPQQPLYKCEECTKTFPRRDNLQRHERSHRCAGLVPCRICFREYRSDYVAKHLQMCEKRNGNSFQQPGVVLKVRARPPCDYLADEQAFVLDNKVLMIHANPETLPTIETDDEVCTPTVGTRQADRSAERELCQTIREDISNNDVEKLEQHLREMQRFGSVHVERDAIFQEFDPLHIQTTLLHDACSSSAAKEVNYLLEAGSDVNEKDVRGGTALHFASYQGADHLIEVLVAKGADVDATNSDGFTPLGLAIANDDRRCMSRLRDAGANIDRKRGFDHASPLQVACRYNNFGCVMILLNWDANIHLGQRTPLYLALIYGSPELTELLLKADARVTNSVEQECYEQLLREAMTPDTPRIISPFRFARRKLQRLAQYKKTDVALEASKNLDLETNDSKITERAVGSINRGYSSKGLELLGSGRDGGPSLEDVVWRYSQLHGDILIDAARRSDIPLATLLLQSGHDTNAIDEKGYTALHIASMKGSDKIVKLLLQYGARIDSTLDGATPLCFAARKTRYSTVKLLVRWGASVNGGSGVGDVIPLVYAAGSPLITEYLIERGADVNRRGRELIVPLQAALTHGSAQVVEMLLKAGGVIDRVPAWCMRELRQRIEKGTKSYAPVVLVDAKNKLQLLEKMFGAGVVAERMDLP